MKELQPINQNVLLDMSEEEGEQMTAGGIIIPGTAKEKKRWAKVLALSQVENAEIRVGETVLFKEYSGTEIAFEGRKYRLVPYGEILAKIVETEPI